MKLFHCNHCGQLVFFENVRCLKCDRRLAFFPDLGILGSLEPGDSPEIWKSLLPRAARREFRLCQNYSREDVCNWTVPSDDANPRCLSCRLTRVIPNLSQPGHKLRWFRLEAAKRRLVYSLLALGLPLRDKADDPEGGLAFEFLADPTPGAIDAAPVLTGHQHGLITINIAEADDSEREKRRVRLHEPYRTLLGHFRHEVGHYYWDRLIRDSDWIGGFRKLFGDEQDNYDEALKRYYAQGALPDWQERFVSAYAAVHPWEDWAETWAHYLHMVDALETAAACGVSLHPRRGDEPTLAVVPDLVCDAIKSFDDLVAGWYPLTYMLNTLNRGLGHPDAYPFVLSALVVDKLRFVHTVVGKAVGTTGRVRPAEGAGDPHRGAGSHAHSDQLHAYSGGAASAVNGA